MYSRIGYGEDNIEGARKRIEQLEIKAREQVCEFLQSALPDDEDLKECISQNNELCIGRKEKKSFKLWLLRLFKGDFKDYLVSRVALVVFGAIAGAVIALVLLSTICE